MPESTDLLCDLLRQTAAEARDAGRLAEAEGLYLQALELDPSSAETAHLLAGVRYRLGKLADAEKAYRRVVELAPDALGAWRMLATLLLSQGRYAEGFPLFEARHHLPGLQKPTLPFREWTGEDPRGKGILIWPEPGLRDQIQMARFAPVLKAMGADVTLLCAPALARLFQGGLGVRVLAAAGEVAFPDPDLWVMTTSVPWRLGVTPESLPATPYLRALDPPPALPSGFKVGVTTRGSAAPGDDVGEPLPAEAEELLRGVPGAVALDPADRAGTDLADAAALISGLDLVISTDTAIAHLAGAMGKPCWTLIPAEGADWRWLLDRRDSPWYPSMRLYRQARGQPWTALAKEIVADASHAASAR